MITNPTRFFLFAALICVALAQPPPTQAASPPSEPWLGPTASVTQSGNLWLIEGKANKVTLNANTLALSIRAGDVTWAMTPADDRDMQVRRGDDLVHVKLTSARNQLVVPYNTGYLQGVKIRLSEFPDAPGLSLVLTLGLEGEDEELVCTASAVEGETRIHILDWPKPLDAGEVDFTVLSNFKGCLLPRNWDREYYPMGGDADHHGLIESNLIECWSMAWWGFQKGKAAMMIIVETSDDAAYQFSHPPGGPTIIGPRWRDSLGKLGYPRQLRMCFFPEGNYVTLAKRYRKHVMDNGHFVSLKDKIAREPNVARLIGTPQTRQHALRNYRPGFKRYNETGPERSYNATTFKELADRLREYKAAGIENLIGVLCGWPRLGYDREHPNVLPPAPECGGWDGMREWVETCKSLGYVAVLHDQYRDYYTDSPSWSLEFSVHEESDKDPQTAFPGTRFNDWKEGRVPYMDNWDGGPMTYLNARFQLGHMIKNYLGLAAHGIHPEGSYLDVYGYVPPTQDFNPDHPLTRRGNMEGRAACFKWARNNLGIVGTESGADWTIPYVDVISGNRDPDGIPVPLYQLVYHDAVITHGGDFLSTIVGGGIVSLGRDGRDEAGMERLRKAIALHKRIALVELVDHEFLNPERTIERSTFADGTTVTIDRPAGTFEVGQ